MDEIEKIVMEIVNEITLSNYLYRDVKTMGLEELGFDSLKFVGFIVAIEEKLNVDLDLLEGAEMKDLESIIKYVYKRVNDRFKVEI